MLMRNPVSRIATAIVGPPELGNLEHRLFTSLCLGGSLVGLASALENAAIGAGPLLIAATWLQSGILLTAYVLSRFFGFFRGILWPVQFFFISLLGFQFFQNAGSSGGAQYFFLICGLIGTIIMEGWQRYLIAFVYIACLNAVLAAEYLYPSLLTQYPSRESRYIDVAFSYSVCLVISGVLTAFLAGHYREVLRRLQRHRVEFFEDLHLARIIQEEVFAHDPRLLDGLDASITYKPSSELSGDLYELTRLDSGVLRILLADVKGHGINAALSAMLAKSEWRHSGHETLSCAPA
ncbi:MAG: hypothetical protein HY042_13325, partial [Spirochaetia bacterium]|nr:hypothetical protein [Spirochaetia bacterium]